jgi:hypothetical protein
MCENAIHSNVTSPLRDAQTGATSQVLSKTPASCATPLAACTSACTSASTPLSMHALDAQDSAFSVPSVQALLQSRSPSCKACMPALLQSMSSPCMDIELDRMLPEGLPMNPPPVEASDGCMQLGGGTQGASQPCAPADTTDSLGWLTSSAAQFLPLKRPLVLPGESDNPTEWLSEIPTARIPICVQQSESCDLTLPSMHKASSFPKRWAVRGAWCTVGLVAAAISARSCASEDLSRRRHRSDVEKVWPFG